MTKNSTLLAGLCLGAALALWPSASQAQTAFGVTSGNKLVTFNLNTPGTYLTSQSITGLRGANGTTADPFGSIFELSYNHLNGRLYGMDGNANLYVINALTGAATLLGSSFAPNGYAGGLAFDPFANAFRFVSDAGENVKLGLDGSVTVGGTVFYASEDVNATSAAAFAGLGIDVDFGTGYALDANLDTIAYTIDPLFREFFTLGSLGFDVTDYASLDVDPTGVLYAALSVDASSSSLYRISTDTGAATKVGDFQGGLNAMAVPEPSTGAALLGGIALLLARRQRRGAGALSSAQ